MNGLRTAGIEDLQTVYELICELEGKTFDADAFRKVYEWQLNDDRHICFLYEQDGIAAGFMNLRFSPQLHQGGETAEIEELIVRDGSRSQGIGKCFLDEAFRRAQERGCVRIDLGTSVWRTDAQRFYLRAGFEKTHLKLTKKFEYGPNR